MANKLSLTVVLAMAMVALVAANTYTTTTVTTTVDEEANPGRQQQCRQQLQGRRFNSCQRYLSQSRGGDDEMVEMVAANPWRHQEEDNLRQCCQELKNVQDQCQCEAIRHAARQTQQEQGQGQGYGYGGSESERERGQGYGSRGQSEQIYQRAQQLPRRCNLSEQQCQFRVVFV